MNRNRDFKFSQNPTNVSIQRSAFWRNSSHKFTFNAGDLIPFYVDEVLPGDTFELKTSKVVRLQTMIAPIMDDIYLDTYYFYVPNRLVWTHWQNFCGENSESPWIPETEYTIPQIEAPSGGFAIGTIADYMGIPTGIDDFSVSALPFRAYAKICDDWFRNENVTDPLKIDTDETTRTGVNTGNYVTDTALGGLPFKASKYHDYFTSCLPSPQKGVDVSIGVTGQAPVVGNGYSLGLVDGLGSYSQSIFGNLTNQVNGLELYTGFSTDGFGHPTGTSSYANVRTGGQSFGVPTAEQLGDDLYKSGLVADMSALSAATVNQLRLAFQLQKLYELDARGGTRYVEILKSHFGVTAPDFRLQRSEYLGGNRLPININQVIQTSGTSDVSPQGTPTAYSLTIDNHGDFIKSFVEHGFIIGVCVARYNHTYQQGLERFWSRKDRFDYYWPVLANIGEQGVKNKEIYLQGDSEVNPDTGKAYDDEIFGYQEAWADYRYKPSRVSSEMRSGISNSLDFWHLADNYSSMPFLSDAWMRENKSVIDRSLAVTSEVSNQLFADFYIQNKTVRPMPLYSIPGFIDHH